MLVDWNFQVIEIENKKLMKICKIKVCFMFCFVYLSIGVFVVCFFVRLYRRYKQPISGIGVLCSVVFVKWISLYRLENIESKMCDANIETGKRKGLRTAFEALARTCRINAELASSDALTDALTSGVDRSTNASKIPYVPRNSSGNSLCNSSNAMVSWQPIFLCKNSPRKYSKKMNEAIPEKNNKQGAKVLPRGKDVFIFGTISFFFLRVIYIS